MKKLGFKHTFISCYIGYFVQATVCGFLPLLFVIFNRDYGISLSLITLLTTVVFVVQLAADSTSILFVGKIGYKKAGFLSYFLAALGLFSLGMFAPLFENIYIGILISSIIFAAGGGFLEVVLSPVIEGCPSKNKASAMSLLHSMFGFGSALMIILTTFMLKIFGKESWRYISIIWAAVSLLNGIYFLFVPINEEESAKGKIPMRKFFKDKRFLMLLLIMACGGASEIGMSQWASAFAESSLGISKAKGDILGAFVFAIMMALARFLHSKLADKLSLTKCIILSGIFTVFCYIAAALVPFDIVALIACGVCGFTVGVFWPGTLSLAKKEYPQGGSTLFALLALGGDIGCTLGPSVVGFMASIFGGELKTGLLFGAIFPALLVFSLLILKKTKIKKQ